jgi:hypothetical protein
MEQPNSVKATFTLTEDFTESIAELIEAGEITDKEELVRCVIEWMAEDVAMFGLNEPRVKEKITVEVK